MSIDINKGYVTAAGERGKFAKISDSWLSSMGYDLSAGEGRYAVLTYDVASSQATPVTPASSSLSAIPSSSQYSVLSGAAISLTDVVTIAPTAKLIRISFTGSGDVNITYDGTTPTSTIGEIWFKGGILEVNPTVASAIKLIKTGTTNGAIYVTQFA